MTSIFRPEPEFTLRIPQYNKVEHLHGTMVEFGKYTLKYTPPEGADESDIMMSISAETDLDKMLLFFELFLLGAGYVFDGHLVIEDPDALVCEKHWDEFWEGANEDEVLDNN